MCRLHPILLVAICGKTLYNGVWVGNRAEPHMGNTQNEEQ